MKKNGILAVFAVIFFLLGYFGMGFIHKRFKNKMVLSDSSEKISYPTTLPTTPIPTPTQTPSPTPKPTNAPIPTPTYIPQLKASPQEIHGFMERFSGQYGIDVNVLRHVAVCESDFDPLAQNGKYAGLYQFDVVTWQNNRRLMGEEINPDLRFNAEEAVQTAAFLISKGKRYLWPNCFP